MIHPTFQEALNYTEEMDCDLIEKLLKLPLPLSIATSRNVFVFIPQIPESMNLADLDRAAAAALGTAVAPLLQIMLGSMEVTPLSDDDREQMLDALAESRGALVGADDEDDDEEYED